MKNLNLSIANPCSENWSTFKSTQAGGFCQSCSVEVIDFTSMHDAEILHFFTNRPSETCGRFRSGQLKIYSHPSQRSSIKPGVKLLRAGLLVLLFGLLSKPVAAHIINEKIKIETSIVKENAISITVSEHLIKGVIKSEEGDPMPGVNIHSKTGIDGTVSNANGEFEFPRKLAAGEVIIFSFIGFETIEYTVPTEPKALLDIQMRYDTCIILGKVAVDEVYGQQHGIQKFWQKIKNVF